MKQQTGGEGITGLVVAASLDIKSRDCTRDCTIRRDCRAASLDIKEGSNFTLRKAATSQYGRLAVAASLDLHEAAREAATVT